MTYALSAHPATSLPSPRDLFALTKPAVSVLLTVTAVATAIAATGPSTDPWVLPYLALAGFLTAAGSGALNHYLDRDVDGLMARTSRRPIPSGRVVVPEVAAAWGAILAGAGTLVAIVTLPAIAAGFIVLGFVIYVPIYTGVLKRRTPWNVVIGGAAGCCPVLAGWATVRADWPVAPLALAAAVFFWSPAHFWAYAARHVDDYRRAGLPMLPAVVGLPASVPYIAGHVAPAIVAALAAVAAFTATATPIALGLSWLAAGTVSLALAVSTLRLWRDPTPLQASALYHLSNRFLAVVFVAVAAGARGG